MTESCKKSTRVSHPINIDTLTQDIYAIDSTGSPSKGIILAAPYDSTVPANVASQGLLMVMDQSGRLLQRLATPGQAFCFNRWVIDGKTRYTYFVNDPSAFRPPKFIEPAGYGVIADSNLNTLQEINVTPFPSEVFQPTQPLDIHDFILVSDNDYIALIGNWEHPGNIPARLSPAPNVSVVAPVIEEVRNGVVVWSWDATSDTTFYATSVEGNDFSDTTLPADYIHMNSMIIDPTDGNLICSMRNQDQIVKINRKTGAVMWHLGGKNSDFPLTADQVFLRQHNATLTDSNQTLLIFDDGLVPDRTYSRIVEFHLDQGKKVVTSFKYFNIPEPFTRLTGSVQKIGDDYFIGGGTAGYILDINYNSGQKVIEYKSSMANYRAYKY